MVLECIGARGRIYIWEGRKGNTETPRHWKREKNKNKKEFGEECYGVDKG